VIVLDTSYSSAAVFPDESTPRSLSTVMGDALITTPMWALETANTVRTGLLRKRFTLEQAHGFASAFSVFELEVVSNSQIRPLDAYLQALRFELTPYDAAFVALALARNAALATCDQKMIDIGRTLGLKIFS
jgi:predicted nucleic acid-binding protein